MSYEVRELSVDLAVARNNGRKVIHLDTIETVQVGELIKYKGCSKNRRVVKYWSNVEQLPKFVRTYKVGEYRKGVELPLAFLKARVIKVHEGVTLNYITVILVNEADFKKSVVTSCDRIEIEKSQVLFFEDCIIHNRITRRGTVLNVGFWLRSDYGTEVEMFVHVEDRLKEQMDYKEYVVVRKELY